MNEYEKYLRSLGATDETLKVLDTPVTRKMFENYQAAEAARVAAETKAATLQQNTDRWYNEDILPKYTATEAEAVQAKAEADRAKTVIREMAKRDASLAQVAKNMGYDVEVLSGGNGGGGNGGNGGGNNGTPTGFDPSKYVTIDTLTQVAEREGDAIALAQDIAAEHSRLFPGQSLNFRELRKEAVQRRVPVEQLWQEKYKVPEARAAQAEAARIANENKIREDERQKVQSEFASKYGDPNQRPLVPSSSPFTNRPAADTARAGKQPWDATGNSLERDRIMKGTQAVLKAVQ